MECSEKLASLKPSIARRKIIVGPLCKPPPSALQRTSKAEVGEAGTGTPLRHAQASSQLGHLAQSRNDIVSEVMRGSGFKARCLHQDVDPLVTKGGQKETVGEKSCFRFPCRSLPSTPCLSHASRSPSILYSNVNCLGQKRTRSSSI